MDPLWRLLTSRSVDLLLSAHDHHYERFTKRDGNGLLDAEGTRPMVVGTGGSHLASVRSTDIRRSITECMPDGECGVLELILLETSYQWRVMGSGDQPGDRVDVPDSSWARCNAASAE